MNIQPGIYRLANGQLATLTRTETGYCVTTPDGVQFITDTEVTR